jgi:hypothetical protein
MQAVADEYAKEYKRDTAKGTGEVIDLWKMDIGAMAEEEYLGYGPPSDSTPPPYHS